MTADNGHSAADGDAYDDREPVGRVRRDESTNRRNLSEISHLFLSDLRRSQGQGRTPPKRLPPGRHREDFCGDETVDLTPDEFAGRTAGASDAGVVSAVVVARGDAVAAAADYAAGVGDGRPVGLVIVDADGVRLGCVNGDVDEQHVGPITMNDPLRVGAALKEMRSDVHRWLVVVGDSRLPHARRLLAGIGRWTLITTGDHDGVVAGYRTLKGLSDLRLPDVAGPAIALALHDAPDAAEARRHARKLVGVCRQFLDLSLLPPDDAAADDSAVFHLAEPTRYREVLVAAWPTPAAAAEGWDVLTAALTSPRRPVQPSPAEPDFNQSSAEHRMSTQNSADHRPTNDSADYERLFGAAGGASAQPAPFLPDSVIPPIARPMPRRDDAPPPTFSSSADSWVMPAGHREAMERNEAEARKLAASIRVPHLSRPSDADLYEPAPPTRPATAGKVGPRFYETPAVDPTDSPIPFAPTAMPDQTAPANVFPSASVDHPPAGTSSDEVIDLPADGAIAGVVVERLGLAATPVAVPGLPNSRLCVSRDGALTVVTAAAPGLSDLGQIGRSLAWAAENRQLLGMALSQYRLDAGAEVRLHLLVGHADARAGALRPLLGTGRVSVQTYRKLTWGGRIGVLLEAA